MIATIVAVENLDVQALSRSLALDYGEQPWLVADPDNPSCHSRITIKETEPKGVGGGEEGEPPPEPTAMYSIQVSTYRSPPDEENTEPPPTHSAFFESLVKHMENQVVLQCFILSDLLYPALGYSWRIPLLATPPTIGEFKSDLGAVVLAGLTLEFDESPAGLSRVSLDTSPFGNEYSVEIWFRTQIEVAKIGTIYEHTLHKIRTFADFFIQKGTTG